jgi:hypothetical protein
MGMVVVMRLHDMTCRYGQRCYYTASPAYVGCYADKLVFSVQCPHAPEPAVAAVLHVQHAPVVVGVHHGGRRHHARLVVAGVVVVLLLVRDGG